MINLNEVFIECSNCKLGNDVNCMVNCNLDDGILDEDKFQQWREERCDEITREVLQGYCTSMGWRK